MTDAFTAAHSDLTVDSEAVTVESDESTDDTAPADLARKINEEGWTCNGGIHEPGEYDSCIACQAVSNEVARVVLPIIRKAERDAAREALVSLQGFARECMYGGHGQLSAEDLAGWRYAWAAALSHRVTHYPHTEEAP